MRLTHVESMGLEFQALGVPSTRVIWYLMRLTHGESLNLRTRHTAGAQSIVGRSTFNSLMFNSLPNPYVIVKLSTVKWSITYPVLKLSLNLPQLRVQWLNFQ